MSIRKKRLLGILLSFALMLGMLPMMSLTTHAATNYYEIWVGGTRVTSANASDVFKDGTVSYNASSKTLTLDGYSSNGACRTWKQSGITYYSAIYAEQELTIQLNNNNSVTIPADIGGSGFSYDYGIWVCGESNNLTIQGGGKLTVFADYIDISVDSGGLKIDGSTVEVSSNDFMGLWASSDLTITNSTVTSSSYDDAIHGGKVEITDSTVTATNSVGEGIYCSSVTVSGSKVETTEIHADNDVTIKDAEVTADCKKDSGITVNDGIITIESGTVTATGLLYGLEASGKVVIKKDAIVTAIGKVRAFNRFLQNEIAGTGWTNVEGTAGKQVISATTSVQMTRDIKKAVFPGIPAATVKTKPTGKSLNYNGAAQVLATAGEGEGGMMQYALGNEKTWISDWSKSIPTAKDAGTYYVWYRVAGDNDHYDSEPAVVKAEIKGKKRGVTNVTINTATVTKKTIANAIKKAGGTAATVTTITLGKKVKKISAKAFASYKKAKTLVVKTKKLTKKGVKASLKGSKVKTVKVNVGSKNVNKKYKKKYRKIFTKKNAGKAVTVK